MSLITTDEAKIYLRVDSSMEDGLIDSLLMTAEKISADVGRMNAAEWEQLCDESTEEMTVHGEDILVAHAYTIADNGASKLFVGNLVWDNDGWFTIEKRNK